MAVDMDTKLRSEFIEANMLTDEDFNFDIHDDFDLNFENDHLWNNSNDDADHIAMTANLLGLKREDLNLGPLIKMESRPTLSPQNSTSSDQDIWMQNDIPSEITITNGNMLEPVVKLEVLETPPDTPPSMEHGTPPSPTQLDILSLASTLQSTASSYPSIIPISSSSPSSPPAAVASFPSKVKIEPQNGLTTPACLGIQEMTNTNTTSVLSSTQPLVLTAQDLTQLTMQGIVKLTSGTADGCSQPLQAVQDLNKASAIGNTKPAITKPTSTLTPLLPHNMTNLDPKALKRQQRMIKNRESACLSRKKKREYLQKLETEVTDLNMQNAHLRLENQQLRERISELEKENQNLKRGVLPKSMKTTTCLLAVVFMLTLNLAPFSGLLANDGEPSEKVPNVPSQHSGRSLLWMSDIQEAENAGIQFVQNVPLTDPNLGIPSVSAVHQPSNASISPSKCPMFINKTESLRLDSELRGWVLRLEKQKQQKETSKSNTQKKKKMPPMPKLQAWIRGSQNFNAPSRRIWHSKGQNELQIYEPPYATYEDLLKALERREDTFYFVSFSGDHLLLPATAHNKTRRPRMSLVMPAMTLNESMEQPQGHVTMMQIDCEVMDTKMIFVKESLIPPHMLQKENRNNSSVPISRPQAKGFSGSHARRNGTKSTRHKTKQAHHQNP